MNPRIASLLIGGSLIVAGCSPDPSKPASSSGAPAAATTIGSAPTSAKTLHIKRTQGECTFDVDVPEELKETVKDGMSFTLESPSLSFVGFDGTVLHSKPEHALDMFHGAYRDLYRGTENGVQLAIVTKIDAAQDKAGKRSISGMGGEPYASGRAEGCTFSCAGGREREADVVKMCKSVRVTVKAGAKQ